MTVLLEISGFTYSFLLPLGLSLRSTPLLRRASIALGA